jgi:hypothetical protein
VPENAALTAEALIQLPLIRALIEKWNAGRAVHGETFKDKPVPELFGECLDGVHYTEQAEMLGTDMGTIRDRLIAIAIEVQTIYWRTRRAAELTTERDLEKEILP